MKVSELVATRDGQRLYWIWGAMIQRCHNENNRAFSNYGGRGIQVCKAWRESFLQFAMDVGPRPPRALLDRRDNGRGYEPGNCLWVDRKASNSNRRNVIAVDLDGERITLKEACRRRGLPYRPIHKRVCRGWDVSRAINTPIGGAHASTN